MRWSLLPACWLVAETRHLDWQDNDESHKSHNRHGDERDPYTLCVSLNNLLAVRSREFGNGRDVLTDFEDDLFDISFLSSSEALGPDDIPSPSRRPPQTSAKTQTRSSETPNYSN